MEDKTVEDLLKVNPVVLEPGDELCKNCQGFGVDPKSNWTELCVYCHGSGKHTWTELLLIRLPLDKVH